MRHQYEEHKGWILQKIPLKKQKRTTYWAINTRWLIGDSYEELKEKIEEIETTSTTQNP